jgi:N-acetylglucosamine-6-phosphate deacetylase
MIVLAGGDLVLPDGVLAGGSLLIEGERIIGIEPRSVTPAGADVHHVAGATIVPGYIDVHVHGVDGTDVLDGPDAVRQVALALPRYGVTAFCPTSVACDPATLATFLSSIGRARLAAAQGAAAVLPAHLESNFINPDWNGAQPADCLRAFHAAAAPPAGQFSGDDILRVIFAERANVGIVTMAPEIDGGLDLVRMLCERGHLVSIGHSGATYEQANAAIRAGVTHATHLFNRMTPLTHRQPGIVGAVLGSPEVTAEVICDGVHVHPSVVALAIRSKSPDRMMAITDGTAAAGLPAGVHARLGGRRIVAGARSATLDDGTLAGSIITMDRAFRMLVTEAGLPIDAAARLCASTPARQLRLPDRGRLAVGLRADVVVLGPGLEVSQTWIAGRPVKEH